MPTYLSPGVYVEEVPPLARPIAGVGTSTPAFIGIVPDAVTLPARTLAADSDADRQRGYKFVSFNVRAQSEAGRAYFISGWTQYTQMFGDFVGDETGTALSGAQSINTGHRTLAHAVYGFFNNGGTSCYVIRVAAEAALPDALRALAPIGDVSIVTAPGLTSATVYAALTAHCAGLQDRVAILDSVETIVPPAPPAGRPATPPPFEQGNWTPLQAPVTASPNPGVRPANTEYCAFYFPWIQIADPGTQLMQPTGSGLIYVPPSGHIAGIYVRSDATRGVHKAPANEVVQGAVGLRWALGRADQDVLNDDGVNLIRSLNGAIRVWGARTVGGDANGNLKYISTRRYLNFLRESIDAGTQFAVFQPNSPSLWQRIRRNVGDFLLGQWRDGALLGETPERAFFVKCDQDTNPPDVIGRGQVITEIGVAIVQPAEFVIFRVQQTTGR